MITTLSALTDDAPVKHSSAKELGNADSELGPFPTQRQQHSARKPSYHSTRNSAEADLRNFTCRNYPTCLGLAAAMNWQSFTCARCCGEINARLLWKAHQNVRRDQTLAALCHLPSLSEEARLTAKEPSLSNDIQKR